MMNMLRQTIKLGAFVLKHGEVENYMTHTHVGESDAVNLGCAENQQRVKCRRVPA